MNKILPYIVIAIMLGTVIMVVPYLLLGPSDYTSLTEGNALIKPSPTESEQPSAPTPKAESSPVPEPPSEATETEQLDSEERANTEEGDFLNGHSSTTVPAEPTEPPAPIPTSSPTEPEASELASTKRTDLIIKSLSVLSPIVLMTIPSFLIALGVFIYLKKQKA